MKKMLVFSSMLFIATPISIVVSCGKSNNKEENHSDPVKTDTLFIPNINAIDLKLEKYEALEATNKINSQFCFDNLNIFLTGDVSLIKNPDDLIIKTSLSENDNNSIILDFSVKSNKWYRNNRIQNSPLTYSYIINGFRMQSQDENILNSQGGYIDNSLFVDKYKVIAQELKLKKYENISLLTNELLNNKLHSNKDFEQLNLKIYEESSTKEGILKLELSGKYKEEIIKSQIITISNFYKIEKNIFLSFSNINLNLENWFNDLKPIDTSSNKDISNISQEDWFNKYILDFIINDSNFLLDREAIKQLIKEVKFSFNLENNKIQFTFSGQFQNKIFKNNNWENDGEAIKIYQSSIGVKEFSLPTLNDLKNIMINQIQVNEEKLKEHYPSYYLGTQKYYQSISSLYYFDDFVLNKDMIFNKYKQTYFPNRQINFAIDSSTTIFANDFNGEINFNVVLIDQNELNNKSHVKNFSFSNFKSLSNFINTKLNNSVLIKENNLLAYKMIINKLKENKAKVDELFISEEGNKINIELHNFNHLNTSLFFEGEFNSFEEKFNQLKRKVEPTIFQQRFSVLDEPSISRIDQYSIGYKSNLYANTLDVKDWFLINNISYFIESNTNLILTKENNGLNIKIMGKTIIDFSDNESREFETSFYFKLLKSQWDEIKNQ